MLRLGKDKNTGIALDLACGTDIFTRPLAKQNKEIFVGLDMSIPMLTHAQKLMEKEHLQDILFVRATAFKMPFADASFKYVNCCGALPFENFWGHLFCYITDYYEITGIDHY